MITVYIKQSCPYSRAVLAKIEELKAPVTIKNISEDRAAREELLKEGGREQVPFLKDDATGAEMYDSKLINVYLEEHAHEAQH
jgi:glutathione S-transferase